ncbi:hypothetical protein BKA00_007097 [Actinomadura coerulea]|uniref:Uncharacterized protein n=1 Tax=Actinomadura coerulea TaxID=46159 RepID=A0A7X0G678_9ACTN|nr:hypothetical protein [Actinomadura coerulea]MBB6400183.1 hypothetical protein [Actinomadura coerulea]GGQ22596.1 hypothetical protein GCM10010187_43870 [Actinomadura coerulea]
MATATPDSGGPVRWTTESDPEGPDSSRITPVLLTGREPVRLTPNWLWSPRPLKGAFGDLDFGKGRTTGRARRKAEDLVRGLRLSAEPDTVVDESVIYELRRSSDGSRYVQGAYVGFNLGRASEHVLISGEPGKVLADRPETVSIVVGVCNGSNRATISTNPEGRRSTFQFGSHGAAERTAEFITSAGFAPSLSLYEENLALLSAAFAGNAVVHSPENVGYTIPLDVPWRGYWLYMWPALKEELTSDRAYDRWREEVTRRSRLLRHRTEELLREVLGERADQTEITYRDELAPLDGILAEARPGRVPGVQILVDTLRNSGDELWELILDPGIRSLVKARGSYLDPEIHTVQELCQASYVVAVLRRMLAGPVMSVNDYVELPIEQSVQAWTEVLVKHGKLAFRGTSFAVYPFSHFVPFEEGEALYHRDPGRVVSVNDRNGVSGFDHGEWVDPVELLPESYRW